MADATQQKNSALEELHTKSAASERSSDALRHGNGPTAIGGRADNKAFQPSPADKKDIEKLGFPKDVLLHQGAGEVKKTERC